MKFYTMTHPDLREGQWLVLAAAEEVREEIENLPVGATVQVRPVEMEEAEFEQLVEFEG